MEKTMASKDESYLVTGKVCPPKMPMDNVALDNWQSLPPSCLDALFTESSIEGSKIIHSTSLCALLSQASVVLSSDGLSHSSVSLPYYFCNFCDHNTPSKLNLLKHIAGKHVFKCHLCDDFISFTRCGLIQHQLQKHVDAEAMQPILSAKTVQLSTSELLRNIKFLNQFSVSLSSLASDSVNSSLMNSSTKETHLNIHSATNFLTSIVSSNDINSLESKDPDTSSITVCKSSEKDSGFDKVVVENIFEESRNENNETVAKTTLGNVRNLLKQSHDMPHFLNDSDSSVTSSSNRRFSMSPSSTYKQTQDSIRYSAKNLSGDCALMPSFLTEPSSSKKTDLQLVKTEGQNVKSSNMTQRISQWKEETKNVQEIPAEDFIPDKRSPLPSALSSIGTQSLTSASEKKEPEDREASLSPNLSSIPVERLQKQLEEAVSNSAGFIFKETKNDFSGTSEHLSEPLQSISTDKCAPEKYLTFKTKSPDSVSSPPGSKVDNFLLDHEDQRCLENEDVLPFTTAKSNTGIGQTLSSAKLKMKSDNYELLRNLLVQKPKETAGAGIQSGSNRNESQLKFKNDKNDIHCVPNDSSKPSRVDLNSSSTCWPRASDMTLKELLTGSVPHSNNGSAIVVNKDVCAPAMPIYLVCGICNYEFHNKGLFDKHLETCKKLEKTQKEKQKINKRNNNSMALYVECDRAIKQEQEEVDHCFTGTSKSVSSAELTASGLLKSLKDQCLELNLKTARHDTDFLSSDTDSLSSPFYDNHSNKAEEFPCGKKFGALTGFEMSPSMTNANLRPNLYRTIQSLLPNDEGVNLKKDTSTSIPQKRRHDDDDDDADYVYESDQNIESDHSSDSDYKMSSNKGLRNKELGKDRCKRKREMPRRVCKLAVAKQPHFFLTCLHCTYSTGNKTEMRQHLISKHSNNVPFCKATFQNQKESLMYFCCGPNASCNFFSIEGAEIFQHIKLCYSGHLDNFLDNKDDQRNNYAQVLRSLAVAAKKLDSSQTVFYCLRCSFSNCNLQSLAYHAKMNHPDKVAGVMFINRMQPETRVLMVCLVCISHVPVKQWETHPCRKFGSLCCNDNIQTSSVTALKDSSAHQAGSEQGRVSLLCELMAAEKGEIVQHSAGRKGKIFSDSTTKAPKMNNGQCDLNGCVKGHNDELIVKQEVVDVEDSNDVPVYFNNDYETDNSRGHNSFKTDDNNKVKEMFFTEPSTKETKELNHSLVLQNLLSAPTEAEVMPKNTSLLQNLLKSPHMIKEQPTSSLATSKPFVNSSPALPAHSKFSSMLETLSRQASHSNHQTSTQLFINTNDLKKNTQPLVNSDTRHVDALHKAKQMQSLKSDMQIVSNLRAATHQLALNDHTQDLRIDAAQISPTIISRPPLLPLIPPLSPSQCDKNQSSHAPYSNLLRGLLCKVNPKPSNSQNDPDF
nr:hypothetical protein BgiMline_016746 [Biomphalaria glabrata]